MESLSSPALQEGLGCSFKFQLNQSNDKLLLKELVLFFCSSFLPLCPSLETLNELMRYFFFPAEFSIPDL